MEISNVNMNSIGDQNLTTVSKIEGFGIRDQGGASVAPRDRQHDSFEMDPARTYLRDLCSSGKADDFIDIIINSGIQPDCLRAELAFRAEQGGGLATSIILSYLSGNFKDADKMTQQILDNMKAGELIEFKVFADYFAGNFDAGIEAARNLESLFYSPFLCYAYADMLLSLGYIEDARKYEKRYVMLARKHLKNFVSEKEKYDEEKNRQQESYRGKRNAQKDATKEKTAPKLAAVPKKEDQTAEKEQSPALYEQLKDMLERRRTLMMVLKKRDISIDKRPLMFELEDIDAKIALKTGNISRIK